MGGSQKSKRVTWASDEYLCQVRLFLSEESPSTVGLGTQDHLQAKTWASHSSGMVSDDNLPPGFEGTQPTNLWRNKLSQIPLVKWGCPPRFVLIGAWRVVAGEESKEAEIQNQREMRVLEAIYPRPSAIPPDPSMVAGAEDSFDYDQHPPLIPITPIEDEDAATDMLFDSITVNTVPMSMQPQLLTSGASASRTSTTPAHAVPPAEVITGVDPDVLADAHTALSAFMTNNNQGNLIDRDLLIKILSDPKMVEQLVTNHGASTSTQTMPPTIMQNLPASSFQNMISSTTQNLPPTSMESRLRPVSPSISLSNSVPIPISRADPHITHVSRPEYVGPPVGATASGVFYPPPSRAAPLPNVRPVVPDVVSAPSPSVGAPIAKDINYYKSLIQQHGGERQETTPQFGLRSNHHLGSSRESSNIPKSRDSKPKIMKPCIYFNSSRGCRNGANCAYQHDTTSQQRVSTVPDSQSAKRMKMDREITGT